MKAKKIIFKIFSILLILFFIGVFSYLIYELFNPLKELLSTGNDAPLKEILQSYGIWKYIFMILLSTFQVFLTVMPGEPVQILSAITCGPLYGILNCVIGAAIGNTILYLLIKVFDFKISSKKYDENKYESYVDENKPKDMKSVTWFILGLYFAPIIPDGVIAYTAAKNNMKYPRYIIVTTLGIIPQVVACITASTLFMKYSSQIFKLTELIPLIVVGLYVFLIVFLIIKFKKKIIIHILNRSIRATILWLIPLSILTIVVCCLLILHKYIACSIVFGFLVLIIIAYLIFDPKLSKIFTKKKMDYFKNNIVLHQNNFISWLFNVICRGIFYTKLKVKVDRNGIKEFSKPSIILFNHLSAYDFVVVMPQIYPQKVNTVCAYYYFCNYHLGRLLNKFGCFPKFLYQPDISAIKNMHKVIKNNCILALAPEGRLSAYGEMESYIPSTVKFLKKELCDVYIAKSHGTYFSKPKWAKTTRKGRIDLKFEKIFTKEDLEKLTLEQIYSILYDKLYYNEYDWMEQNKVPFKGRKFAEGLEHMLYICPVCGKEFTYESKKNKLTCSHCHTTVKLNQYYQFESENPNIPKNIREWYLLQKQIERKNIQNPNYILQSKVSLKLPDEKGNGFTLVGKGICTLTHEGITYNGIINGENKHILFKLENIPALPFGVNENFEIYHDQTLYYFVPDNIRECVKWSVVEEQMYEDYTIKENIKKI